LNERVVAFPELLHDAGYHTYMAGKWHLGVKEEHSPAKRGFERSYAMVQGGASHFDQTGIITDDPAKTPKALYREDGKPVDIPKEDFYSSAYFSDKIISYIDGNKGDNKPFFAYLAFTAPHWPLQAPDEYIKKYEGKYDVGYDAVRAARLSRMKALGIVPKDIQPYTGNSAWPTWKKLSPLQKTVESKRMAVYAAMVDAMDAQIGRVVDYLKKTGEYDNTLIFFMSDNGADGNSVLDEQADREWVRLHANNSLENTGRKGSFVEYGPGWAQVSSTPMHLYKAFAYEGGIAVPNIVVMPGHLLSGKTSAVPAHVTDVAPTLLELAGLKKPGTEYKGRTIFPMTGESMLSFLSGETKTVHPDGFKEGWELNGRKAMRKGDWKIAYANKPWGSGKWELYNVAKDRSELHDVAKKYPTMLKELVAEYDKYKQDNGVVEFPGLAERKGYSNGTYYYQDILEQTK
ncbi:MAG: sulfatase-like hydrolase/transferase, partial [Noviherbaspirillum sp.]